MIYKQLPEFSPDFQQRLDEHYLRDEQSCVEDLLKIIGVREAKITSAFDKAASLVREVRSRRSEQSHIQKLMHEFSLASEEGVVLMCLAEALLRIPDNHTADQLIQGKMTAAHWEAASSLPAL